MENNYSKDPNKVCLTVHEHFQHNLQQVEILTMATRINVFTEKSHSEIESTIFYKEN